MQGGSSGVMPSGWAAYFSDTGVVYNVVGTGTESGIDYVDIRIHGTTVGTSTAYAQIFPASGIAASPGQQWTWSSFVKLQAGSMNGVNFSGLDVNEYSASAYLTTDSMSMAPTPLALGQQRPSTTFNVLNASTVSIYPLYDFTVSPGVAVDFTVRLGWPQLEQGAYATSPIRTTAGNVTRDADLVSVTGAPLSVLKGSHTNYFTNNSMQGAVVGAPGTLPTGWLTYFNDPGVVYQVVQTGTDSGIDYMDVRVHGTSSGYALAQFFPSSAIPATSVGQPWTFSMYTKLVAGSMTGVNSWIEYNEYNGGTYLTSTGGPFSVTTSSLSSQRVVSSTTVANSSTNSVVPLINLWVNPSTSVDFTIRIGWPQFESGPVASPAIRTTATAVTANSSGPASVVIKAFAMQPASTSGVLLGSNTSSPIITSEIDNTVSSTWSSTRLVSKNILNWAGAATAGMAWDSTGRSLLANAGTAATDLIAAPSISSVSLGANGNGTSGMSGYVTRMQIWNSRLPDATLSSSATTTAPSRGVVPNNFFGMLLDNYITTPFPTIPFGTVRLNSSYVTWAEINTARGVYNWTNFDTVISNITGSRSVDIIYSFWNVPTWSNSAGSSTKPPDNLADWDAYVTAVVTRYHGQIKYWEIWNEPNGSNFYTGSVATMVTMQQHAYSIIKSIDSTAIVLTPSPVGTTGLPWLSAFLTAGGGAYADIMAYHGYWDTTGESAAPITKAYQNVFAGFGYGASPLWDTEASWGSSSTFTNRDGQAATLAKYYLLQWSIGVDRFTWYSYDNNNPYGGPWGQLWNATEGLIKPGIGYGKVNSWMVGAQPLGPATISGAIWQLDFTRSGGYQAKAIWSSSGTPTFPVPAIYTQYRDLDGNVTAITGGTVTLGSKPILLESNSAW